MALWVFYLLWVAEEEGESAGGVKTCVHLKVRLLMNSKKIIAKNIL